MARRTYTAEFKDEAARLVIQDRRSFRDVATSLGVDVSSLRAWVVKARQNGVQPDPAAAKDPAQRLRELEAENRRLRTDNEILKKAAAFFARENRP